MPADSPIFRFAILVHSDFVADEVRRETRALGWDIDIFVTTYDTARRDAERCVRNGYDMLICHGGFRYDVQRDHPQKTIFIERTDFDLLRALLRARTYTSEVIVTAHRDEARDFAFMEMLTRMRIHPIRYAHHHELEQQLERCYAQGLHMAVGGGGTARYMRRLGGQTILDVPQASSIQQAITRAVNLMEARQRERTYTENVLQLMRFSREGVICARLDGVIIYANDEALRLLGLEGQDDLRPLLPDFLTDDLVSRGKARVDDVLTLRRRRLLVSAFPFHLAEGPGAVIFFRDVQSIRSLSRKIDTLARRSFASRHKTSAIIGHSPGMEEVRRRIARYADMQAPVCIHGETGSGKELVAHALHAAGPRADRPFVALNCAALPESLLESELFGYEEGAFTGARRQGKSGLLELAHGGTLFLDEICSVSPAMQVRLLRVLESGELLRVGGDRLITVDMRLVSAANPRRMAARLRDGSFRPDFYYRIMGLCIDLPPLRERKEDLPLLLAPVLAARGRSPACLSPTMREALQQHDWPGNVRELRSVMDIYAQLFDGDSPDEAAFREAFHEHVRRLPPPGPVSEPAPESAPRAASAQTALPAPPDDGPPDDGLPLREQLRHCRAAIVRDTLRRCGGNRREAARRLGVSYASLRRFLLGQDDAQSARRRRAPPLTPRDSVTTVEENPLSLSLIAARSSPCPCPISAPSGPMVTPTKKRA